MNAMMNELQVIINPFGTKTIEKRSKLLDNDTKVGRIEL